MLKRFWTEEGYSDQPSCKDVAPFLTALFDGEVTEEDARQARAHLLACERCARIWLDWNQTRSLLRNESVVAPPPTLMWRVLMAVRLSSQSKSATRVERVEQSEVGYAFGKAPAVRPAHAEHVEVPRDLSARILSQTVGCEDHSHHGAQASRPRQPAGHSHGWRRYSTAFALPVAALTLMLASWHGTGVSPVPEIVVAPEPAAVAAPASQRSVVASGPSQVALPVVQKPVFALVPAKAAPLAASVSVPALHKAVLQDVAERVSSHVGDRSDQDDSVTEQVVREANESSVPTPVVDAVYAPLSAPLLTTSTDHVRIHRSAVNALAHANYIPAQGISADLIVTQPDAPVKLIPTDVPDAADVPATVSAPAAVPDTSDDDNRFAAVASDVDSYRSLFAPDKGVDDDHDIAG